MTQDGDRYGFGVTLTRWRLFWAFGLSLVYNVMLEIRMERKCMENLSLPRCTLG